NGLSFLISSRSAISRRMRAIAWLSNEQPLRLDFVVENPRPAGSERFGNRRAFRGGAEAEQAPAAAGAAYLGRGGADEGRPSDQRLDLPGRHAGRQALAVLPFGRDAAADRFPVAALERHAHLRGGVADPFEAVEDLAIAVDVPLGDVPV